MAKISAKKSNLKTIANKIIVSPSTATVSDLKFKRKKDFKTFVKWIESSNTALARIKLPNKKEVEKLGKGTGGSNWLPALLALLGLGAFAALNKDKDKDKGDSDTGSGVTAEDSGATIPKSLQGPNITGTLDITRQLNNRKNQKNKISNQKFKVKNRNIMRSRIKNRGNFIKNLKSDTLRNKFWKKDGTKPEVTNLGKRWKRVQFKHSSKWMKVGSGKFSATPGKAPFVPDNLGKGLNFNKKPVIKETFGTNIKNLFKPSGLKNLGKGLIAGYVIEEGLVKPGLDLMDKGFFNLSKGIIDKKIKEHGVHKVLAHHVKLRDEWGSKKKVNWATEILTGQNELNKKMFDKFQANVDYIQTKYKDQLNQSKFFNTDTNIPFPIITTDIGEKFDLPTIDFNNSSSSSESFIPFSAGLNNDNPYTDLLLNSLK